MVNKSLDPRYLCCFIFMLGPLAIADTHPLTCSDFIKSFCYVVGRGQDARFQSLVSFLCELAGVASMPARYMPSVVVTSAVVVAGSILNGDTLTEDRYSAEADHHPPSLLALSGYTPNQTVLFLSARYLLYWASHCSSPNSLASHIAHNFPRSSTNRPPCRQFVEPSCGDG